MPFILLCTILSCKESVTTPDASNSDNSLIGSPSPTPDLTPGPTPSPTPAPRPPLEVGVNIHLNRSPQVKLMADLGAKWVRIDMDWCLMEPTDGQWDFSVFDDTIRIAKESGLNIFATLSCTPPWISSNGEHNGLPTDVNKWKLFVQTAVSRYKDKVSAFGIWNEPNLQQFWTGSLDQYFDVVFRPACEIIRNTDKNITLAGPELSHLYNSAISAPTFFNAFKAKGLDNCLDVITHHIYSDMSDFNEKFFGYYFAGVLYKLGLKQWLENAGLWGKPVWITEFGYDVKTGTEAGQAQTLSDELKLMNTISWINKAFIFEMIDDPRPEAPYQMGLLRADNTQRPAYSEIKKTISGF